MLNYSFCESFDEIYRELGEMLDRGLGDLGEDSQSGVMGQWSSNRHNRVKNNSSDGFMFALGGLPEQV